MLTSGAMRRFTPPTIAKLDSRSRKLLIAICTATKEEEQAVSREILGAVVP